MNKFTKTPVNTVWFCAIGASGLGLLVFSGTQAMNAVFSISITALYIAYSIPIAARWIWRKENGWTPGAFSLGAIVGVLIGSSFRRQMTHRQCEIGRADLARSSPSPGWRA